MVHIELCQPVSLLVYREWPVQYPVYARFCLDSDEIDFVPKQSSILVAPFAFSGHRASVGHQQRQLPDFEV